MQLSITIPDDKVAEFRTGFLRQHPNPEDSGMADVQWLKHMVRVWLVSQYRAGKSRLAQDGLVIDSDVVSAIT